MFTFLNVLACSTGCSKCTSDSLCSACTDGYYKTGDACTGKCLQVFIIAVNILFFVMFADDSRIGSCYTNPIKKEFELTLNISSSIL
jgi:hypothetical protein